MRRHQLLLALWVICGGRASAAPADYMGVQACGSCHAAAMAAWQGSAHARASSPRVLGSHVADAACLVCHATGDGANVRDRLGNVECESCHGAGAAYGFADVMRDLPLARALGLRGLHGDPVRCLTCHQASTSPRAFDYATAWERIKH